MRTLIAALLAAPALVIPAPASADVTQPNGHGCDFLSADSDQELHVWAEPLTVVDEDDATLTAASITCALHAGGDHTTAVVDAATGPVTNGAVALAPTVLRAPGYYYDYYWCMRVDHAGGTLYWHEPRDRNADGWWTTDPHARCDDFWETSDLRLQDEPLGTPLTTAFTVLGETDAENALCETDLVGCEDPGLTSFGTVSFARTPAGAVVRRVPEGWGCTDAATGLPVTAGSSLTTPDPAVDCAGQTCKWQELSAYLVPTTLGRVTVTQTCGYASVTRVLSAAQARLVEQWSGRYYENNDPVATGLRCGAVEDTPAEPSYVVSCLAD